jgi:hypothetical protein
VSLVRMIKNHENPIRCCHNISVARRRVPMVIDDVLKVKQSNHPEIMDFKRSSYAFCSRYNNDKAIQTKP